MKTDAQLRQDVCAELTWDPAVNASEIGVAVKDGIVTLTGHVDSYSEKWHAEQVAQRISGVHATAIEISVNLPADSKRSDADIARAASNVLQWTTNLPRDSIKIQVEDGWITLTGDVTWSYQRIAAYDAVRRLFGVTGVSDQITLKPNVSVGNVKTDIEAALRRRAMTDGENISVEVNGDDITLSGMVHTWGERDLARHTAWGTPGVRNVFDNMTIAN